MNTISKEAGSVFPPNGSHGSFWPFNDFAASPSIISLIVRIACSTLLFPAAFAP